MSKGGVTPPGWGLPDDHDPPRVVPVADRRAPTVIVPSPPSRFRARWTEAEIERIIRADPDTESYQSLAKELERTPGAVRKVRVWAGHILKGQYWDSWWSWVNSADPRVRSRRHDVIMIHHLLEKIGFLALPVVEQRRLARELPQPGGAWRGDRTSQALRQHRLRTGSAPATKKRGEA